VSIHLFLSHGPDSPFVQDKKVSLVIQTSSIRTGRNFSRKIFPTVGLLQTKCGTFEEIFLEKFSWLSDLRFEAFANPL